MIHLTTILFQFHHPEDGLITGRNMLINVLEIKKMHHKIEVHFYCVYILQMWLIHGI
jgi:hypothetical protein